MTGLFKLFLFAVPPSIKTKKMITTLFLFRWNLWKNMSGLQLFRQRLYQKNVKSYATMPIYIMGRFVVDWLRFKVLTNKKREGINTFVCAVSLYVSQTPKASIKDRKLPLPIIPVGMSRTVLVNNLSRNSCILFTLCVKTFECTRLRNSFI